MLRMIIYIRSVIIGAYRSLLPEAPWATSRRRTNNMYRRDKVGDKVVSRRQYIRTHAMLSTHRLTREARELASALSGAHSEVGSRGYESFSPAAAECRPLDDI